MTIEEALNNCLVSLGVRLYTMQRMMRDDSWTLTVPILNLAISDQKAIQDLLAQLSKQGERTVEVEKLPSKIVQYNNADDVALCEDGSVWEYLNIQKSWKQVHPPHEPPKHAADLAEALDALKKLNDVDIDDEYGVQQAIFKNADRVLQKHGMQVYQPPKSES